MMQTEKAKNYVLLARRAHTGVIFRRGPSKQVQLIKWDLNNDSFKYGQWFKGRIYERRCDLSPDGNKLIYFAANYKKPYFSWTAVSHPPYFTALLLWPKGNCWGGGGLFEAPLTISLNHRNDEMKLAEDFALPKNIKVRPLNIDSGSGEDNPICHIRINRDGWKLIQEGSLSEKNSGKRIWVTYDPPAIYSKKYCHKAEKNSKGFDLMMIIKGLHERGGDWYIVEYELVDEQNNEKIKLGRMDWADWDKNGDLLFSEKGKMFRLKPDFESHNFYSKNNAIDLADFNSNRFEEKLPPKEALKW